MFVISLTYCKPLSDVDACLSAHIDWLNAHFSAGKFLVAGAKIPRTGGVIIAHQLTRECLDEILQHDPFFQQNIATYEVIEFEARVMADELTAVLS